MGGRREALAISSASTIASRFTFAAMTSRFYCGSGPRELLLRDVLLGGGNSFLRGFEIANRGGEIVLIEAVGDGLADLVEALGGESDHAGPRAAERHAQQSRHARQGEHLGESGNQRLARVLVQAILHGVPK